MFSKNPKQLDIKSLDKSYGMTNFSLTDVEILQLLATKLIALKRVSSQLGEEFK